ncbi:hypothetical protein HYFRA_00011101 [Hymenoscyphus fraxineus]|uniref:Fungal lipase-type domain-containing protein n=1 Tax=Hymenoscyphus fraxineus TaxID=746836 RepID=A0A9N9L2S1_9HELO|nr:hypothetical protein HYFRA_00011101 [Hymenoscyphus fraxineus]
MKFLNLSLSYAALQLLSVTASPVDIVSTNLEKRATPTVVNDEVLARFRHYVQFSAAAYCNSEENLFGSKVTCAKNGCPTVEQAGVINNGYLGIELGSQSMVNGFVGLDHTNKQIVVAYHGTKSPFNFITDLIIPLEPCNDLVDGCKMHSGFQNAWGDVRQDTFSNVQAALRVHPQYKVITTGHSLGGAIATIAGAYLRQAGIPTDIYTFGSPRPGNGKFADYVNAGNGAHYRVTHTNDPIATLPAKWTGYRHSGVEFWLSTGGAETVDYNVGDVKVCEGTSNENCNDGEGLSLSLDPHRYYFQRVSVCKSTTSPITW